MDDRELAVLQEIRDLLQRTVANQEQVLRANDEAMRLYRAAGRRQLWGIVSAIALMVLLYFLVVTVTTR